MKIGCHSIFLISLILLGVNSYGATITSEKFGDFYSVSTSVAGSDLHASFESLLVIFMVTNTNNSGAGSLRQAILDANANPGLDEISFSIPGAGPHIINVTSALPNITDPLVIDGTSEPDFINTPVVRIDGDLSGNVSGLVFSSTSDSSTVRGLMITRFNRNGIQIDPGADVITITGNWIGSTGNGSNSVGNSNNGINVQGANTIIGGTGAYDQNVITNNGNEGINLTGTGATGTLIRGNIIGLDPDGSTGSGNGDVGIAALSGANNTIIGGATVAERNIISMNYEGIEINSNNNVVQGNYIGTDVTGTLDRGSRSDDGIEINSSATGNLIGGDVPEAMNVISANALDGIKLNGPSNTILGNMIGLDASGTLDLGNGQCGIRVSGVADNTIGGTTGESRNVISGNNTPGILLAGSNGTVIQGNYIGTDITGTVDLGNDGAGILVASSAYNNQLGGTQAGAGNIIAFNSSDGIWISTDAGTSNAILGNSIYSNSGIGIDLLNDQVTANDAGDIDTGPNDLQNYPLLENAIVADGNTTITGSLNSTADTNFRIEFFSSPIGDASGYGEGQTYLGSTTVNADGSGNATFDTTFNGVTVSEGNVVSATATVDLGNGNYGSTSEFAGNVTASLVQADYDNPCNAAELFVDQSCSFEIFSNDDATDSGIPLTECDGYSGGDLWFKVEVPATGNVIAKIETDAIDHFPANDGWAHRLGLAVYKGSCSTLIYDTCWIEPEGPGIPQSPEILLQGYSPGDTLFLRVWEHNNDDKGEFRICVFTDDANPTINCPPDVSSQANPGSCVDSLIIPMPVTGDNYGIESVINDFNGTNDASDLYPVGITFITWTVKDLVGNTAICIQNITITDNEAPEIIYPGTTSESLDENCQFMIPDYTSSASINDNCDPVPSIIQSPAIGTILNSSGTIQEIVLTGSDEAGNESTFRFNITLIDNTPPEAISIIDTSIIVQEGVYQTSIDMPLPVFADNCGILSMSNDFNGGTDASGIYQYGTTTVVYTVTDINNNTETFNQQVHVGFENEPEHGLIIPEAFSPNEDGLNDRLEILGLEQYSENEFQVYNVHGIEVFRMADYDNSWDGIAKGKLNDGNKLPTGTYYYVLRLIPGDKLIKGFVYLRRE